MKRSWPAGAVLGFLLASLTPCAAYEGPSDLKPFPAAPKLDLEEISRRGEEPKNLWEFFQRRTQIGVGFDEEYDSNIFLEDNLKQKDYISTIEGTVLFADPRGSLLYGGSWEGNAFRYHRHDANAFNQDAILFADLDPGGRIQYHLEYKLEVSNSLIFGEKTTDVLDRSTDFQQGVEHEWVAKLRYALNETNALVSQTSYYLFDLQRPADGSSDRKRFRTALDLDHDLDRTWTVLAGYAFEDFVVPADKPKSYESHIARLGVRREFTPRQKLEATLEIQHPEFKSTDTFTNLGFLGAWQQEVNPRLKVTLSYFDRQEASFSGERLRFRNREPHFAFEYEISPLMKLTGEALYNRQTSGGKDVVSGTPTPPGPVRNSLYTLRLGFKRQIREQAHFTLGYSYTRSKTRDYTRHSWVAGFEASF